MSESFDRPYHPTDLARRAAAKFPLTNMIEELRAEDVYRESSRNALTLIHDEGLRVVLTVAREGTECGEHKTNDPALIIGLDGELSILGSGGGALSITADSAAGLAPDIPHRIAAITDCAYLTIIGMRPGDAT